MSAISTNGTGGGNFDLGPSWAGGVVPTLLDDFTVLNGDTITQTQAEAGLSGTINSGGTLDQSTFDLDITNAFTSAGDHIMGVSSNTGLTCGSYILTAGNYNYQTESKINVSGTISTSPSITLSNVRRGRLIITASGNIAMVEGNMFNSVTQNVSITSSATDLVEFGRAPLDFCIINAIMAMGSETLRVGGDITFGANSDITGDGQLTCYQRSTETFIVNKVGAFSHTGFWQSPANNADQNIPNGNWENADIQMPGPAAESRNRFLTGNTAFKDILISGTSANIVLNNTGNYNLTIHGTVDFASGSYTRGASSKIILQTGTANKDIDFNGQTLRKIEMNSGLTFVKELKDNVKLDSVEASANGGIIEADTGGTMYTMEAA